MPPVRKTGCSWLLRPGRRHGTRRRLKGHPEFIWRVVLKSASVEPAEEMVGLLERMADTGAGPSDVLADCGYSFKTGLAAPTRRIGAEPSWTCTR